MEDLIVLKSCVRLAWLGQTRPLVQTLPIEVWSAQAMGYVTILLAFVSAFAVSKEMLVSGQDATVMGTELV